MGDRTLVDGHADKVLLGGFYAFGDSGGDFVGFAQAPADDAVFVTYHHDGGESERTSTLGNFGNAVDGYQAVLEFYVVG